MIKIAVNGQIFQESSLVYYTPSDNDNWTRSIIDIRDTGRTLTRNDIDTPYMYLLWENENGHYFSYASVNKKEQRHGWVMITLCLEHSIPKSGEKITTCLKEIFDYVINKDGIDYESSKKGKSQVLSDEIDEIITRNILPEDLTNAYLPMSNCILPEDNRENSEDALRIYSSNEDLFKCIQFPSQSEYKVYKKIYLVCEEIVTEEVKSKKGQKGICTINIGGTWHVDYIVSPIKKIYTINIADGVCVLRDSKVLRSGEKLMDGDIIDVAYQKSGYKDCVKGKLEVGSFNDYFYHDGLTLVVRHGQNNPKEMGIEFKKQFGVNLIEYIGYFELIANPFLKKIFTFLLKIYHFIRRG